jgi:hypothetical protein
MKSIKVFYNIDIMYKVVKVIKISKIAKFGYAML